MIRVILVHFALAGGVAAAHIYSWAMEGEVKPEHVRRLAVHAAALTMLERAISLALTGH